MHGHGGHSHDAQGHTHAAGGTPGVAPDDTDTPFVTGDKVVLLLSMITYGIGQSVLFIVLQPLVERIGLTLSQFGFIMAASNLALALSAIYWGRKSDAIGRKPTLVMGLFGYALGTAIVAACLEWGLRGSPAPMALFAALLVARLIYGCLASAINPAATAYMADTTSRANRSRGMALIGMTSGVGTLLGPLVGGAFAFISPIAPMYIAISLAVIAIAAILTLLNEPAKHESMQHANKSASLKWSDRRVLPFLLLLTGFWMCFTMIQIITAFYIEKQVGVEGITRIQQTMMIALICMALAAIIMQTVIIQMFSISTKSMLRFGLPIFVLGLAALFFSTNVWLLCIAFALMGAAMAMANAGITGGASLSVEPNEQGAVGGFLSAAPILGMVLGPLISTNLFQWFSPTFPVLTSLCTMLLLSAYAFTVKVPDK